MINRMIQNSFIELFIYFSISTITSTVQNELKRSSLECELESLLEMEEVVAGRQVGST